VRGDQRRPHVRWSTDAVTTRSDVLLVAGQRGARVGALAVGKAPLILAHHAVDRSAQRVRPLVAQGSKQRIARQVVAQLTQGRCQTVTAWWRNFAMCKRSVTLGALHQLNLRHTLFVEQVVKREDPQAQTSRRD